MSNRNQQSLGEGDCGRTGNVRRMVELVMAKNDMYFQVSVVKVISVRNVNITGSSIFRWFAVLFVKPQILLHSGGHGIVLWFFIAGCCNKWNPSWSTYVYVVCSMLVLQIFHRRLPNGGENFGTKRSRGWWVCLHCRRRQPNTHERTHISMPILQTRYVWCVCLVIYLM